ncbi:hypothetical protein DLAC_11055 [Tieghemostelium lacteum]|uniref:Thioredoxin domain-containing protein n=1 Tax=Tieghemostelium lacteum TaxID=361077 RepID=A0A151Z326_TIELA|nr:hypothetical protein DLAC_11055 [Tieghemostelium lacteum]|eukprot:KYQ88355.1 hypothetical protein DLAC_11055 [Tieghemostelium lacteum]
MLTFCNRLLLNSSKSLQHLNKNNVLTYSKNLSFSTTGYRFYFSQSKITLNKGNKFSAEPPLQELVFSPKPIPKPQPQTQTQTQPINNNTNNDQTSTTTTTSNIIELNLTNFEPVVMRSKLPVILNCYSQNSDLSKKLNQKFTEYSQKYHGCFILGNLNVEEQVDITQTLRIQSLPTFFTLNKGVVLKQYTGLPDDISINTIIEDIVKLSGGMIGEKSVEELLAQAESGVKSNFNDTVENSIEIFKTIAEKPDMTAQILLKCVIGCLQGYTQLSQFDKFDEQLVVLKEHLPNEVNNLQIQLLKRIVDLKKQVAFVYTSALENETLQSFESKTMLTDPLDLSKLYELSLIYYQVGRYQESIQLLLTILKTDKQFKYQDTTSTKDILLKILDSLDQKDPMVIKSRQRFSKKHISLSKFMIFSFLGSMSNEKMITKKDDFELEDEYLSTQQIEATEKKSQSNWKPRNQGTNWIGDIIATVDSMEFYNGLKFNGIDYFTDNTVLISVHKKNSDTGDIMKMYKISSIWENREFGHTYMELIHILKPEELEGGRKSSHGLKQVFKSKMVTILKLNDIKRMTLVTVESQTNYDMKPNQPMNVYYCVDKELDFIHYYKGKKRALYDDVIFQSNQLSQHSTPPFNNNQSSQKSLNKSNSSDIISPNKKRKNIDIIEIEDDHLNVIKDNDDAFDLKENDSKYKDTSSKEHNQKDKELQSPLKKLKSIDVNNNNNVDTQNNVNNSSQTQKNLAMVAYKGDEDVNLISDNEEKEEQKHEEIEDDLVQPSSVIYKGVQYHKLMAKDRGNIANYFITNSTEQQSIRENNIKWLQRDSELAPPKKILQFKSIVPLGSNSNSINNNGVTKIKQIPNLSQIQEIYSREVKKMQQYEVISSSGSEDEDIMNDFKQSLSQSNRNFKYDSNSNLNQNYIHNEISVIEVDNSNINNKKDRDRDREEKLRKVKARGPVLGSNGKPELMFDVDLDGEDENGNVDASLENKKSRDIQRVNKRNISTKHSFFIDGEKSSDFKQDEDYELDEFVVDNASDVEREEKELEDLEDSFEKDMKKMRKKELRKLREQREKALLEPEEVEEEDIVVNKKKRPTGRRKKQLDDYDMPDIPSSMVSDQLDDELIANLKETEIEKKIKEKVRNENKLESESSDGSDVHRSSSSKILFSILTKKKKKEDEPLQKPQKPHKDSEEPTSKKLKNRTNKNVVNIEEDDNNDQTPVYNGPIDIDTNEPVHYTPQDSNNNSVKETTTTTTTSESKSPKKHNSVDLKSNHENSNVIKKQVASIFSKKFTFKESFDILIQYVISAVLDDDFIQSVKEQGEDETYFSEAFKKVRDTVVLKKEILVRGSQWEQSYTQTLSERPFFHSQEFDVTSSEKCQSCKRSKHAVSILVHLSGKSYNVEDFWDGYFRNPKRLYQEEEKSAKFELGSFCSKRSELFHELHHFPYKLFRVIKRDVRSYQDNHPNSKSEQILNSLLNNHNLMDSYMTRLQLLLKSADDLAKVMK